jgi:hypothetical protein
MLQFVLVTDMGVNFGVAKRALALVACAIKRETLGRSLYFLAGKETGAFTVILSEEKKSVV